MGHDRRLIELFRKGIVILLLAAGCFFSLLAYMEYQPFKNARIKQEAVRETAVKDANPEDFLYRRIDFHALKEINPDIIGWLYVPQIGVDQPILQGTDDSEYLYLDFEGCYSPLGSIFTWADADENLQEQHICIFGHNMLSGQMFGELNRFKEKTFTEENGTLYIYTPERAKEVQVISVSECYKTDDIFQDEWDSGMDCQVVTLATCTGYLATPYRLVVNGEVIREKIVL